MPQPPTAEVALDAFGGCPRPRTLATVPGAHRSPAPGIALLAAGVAVAAVAVGLTVHGPVSGGAPTTMPSTLSQADEDPVTYAQRLLLASNDARSAAGLPDLAPTACALPVAQARATALVGRPLAHAPLDDLLHACSPATVDAENLSRAAAGPADVVAAWMASPGHRANLLDPALDTMTVACVHDGEAMLCAQLFTGP